MHWIRKFTRNPSLLLLIAASLVFALSLLAFGAAHQTTDSASLMGMPGLWFISLIVLPFVLYFLLMFVWKRFDRIAR